MTEEQATELGRRAVAAGWRVWPGQLSLAGARCTVTPIPLSPRPDDTPDFRDPATLGILRAQVVALEPGAVEVFAEWLEPYQKAAVFFVDAHGKPTTKHANEPIWQPTIVPCTTASLWPAGALVACLEAAKAGEL